MASRQVIDCTTGQVSNVPLNPAEQADFDAAVAAAPGLAAAAAAITANYVTLQQRAQAALAANATYLGLSSPTNAQVIVQVALLTRETTALIRLFLNLLDSTAGT